MKRAILATVLVLTAGSAGVQVQTTTPATAGAGDDRTLNLSAYAELLRRDVQAEKIAILTEVMGFTEAEDKAFWPIYREYEAEMSKLGDRRVELVRQYAANYSNITDDVASKLASTALELERERDAAKARCYEKVKAALSPRTALRFLQVEHQLQLLIDLQIAAALPVAPGGKE